MVNKFCWNLTSEMVAEQFNLPYIVAESVAAAIAVLGNSLVILLFVREKQLRKRTKYFIISLAVADLLVGLLGIPSSVIASTGHPQNFHLCLFSASLVMTTYINSIFSLIAVSVDRYWAIIYPMSFSANGTTLSAIVIICISWLAGTAIGFMPLFGLNAGQDLFDQCILACVFDYNYLVVLHCLFIVLSLMLVFFYTSIYTVIIRQRRQFLKTPANSADQMRRMRSPKQKNEFKAAQRFSVIVLFFVVCFLPVTTLKTVEKYCKSCNITDTHLRICLVISHLNSSFNPLLYAYHLKDFRSALGRLLKRTEDISFITLKNTSESSSSRINYGFDFKKSSTNLAVEKYQPKIGNQKRVVFCR